MADDECSQLSPHRDAPVHPEIGTARRHRRGRVPSAPGAKNATRKPHAGGVDACAAAALETPCESVDIGGVAERLTDPVVAERWRLHAQTARRVQEEHAGKGSKRRKGGRPAGGKVGRCPDVNCGEAQSGRPVADARRHTLPGSNSATHQGQCAVFRMPCWRRRWDWVPDAPNTPRGRRRSALLFRRHAPKCLFSFFTWQPRPVNRPLIDRRTFF